MYGVANGFATINMNSQDGNILASRVIEVNSDIVEIYDFDTIVSFLQVFIQQPSTLRYEPSMVRLQVTPGLFFARAMVNITVSAVLNDGSRLLLTDPSELNIVSLNESVVRVENLTLIAESPGSGELITIKWMVCGQILANSTAHVTVAFDFDRPTFSPSSDEISVPEDQPVGQPIYTVTAVDSDADNDQTVHADIEYTLQTGSDYNDLFSIDKDTGDIILSRSLDREIIDSYLVVVVATDARQRMIIAQREMDQGSSTSSSGEIDINPPDEFEVSEYNTLKKIIIH